MKRTLTAMVIFLGILCFASTSQAYYYSCDITGGSTQLNVNADATELSLVTTEDLQVGFTYDAPSENVSLSYTLSTDLNLNLSGFINYELTLDAEPLGVSQSIDPADYLGDGTGSTNLRGQALISFGFSGYYLENASLTYDMLFTPVNGTTGEYTVSINTLILNDGNTGDFLTGIFDSINNSGELPVSLSFPLAADIEPTGSVELTASPVPVPAAIWFLGSGLLGMLGIRRRIKL